jgi:hypothetical protein
MVIAVVRGGFNLVQQVQRKGSHCAWERGHRALGDATRARRPRAVQVHAGKMPTAPALGARASGARAAARMRLRRAGGRDARAPFRFTRARRPRSVQVHGCARLRRAYQQRLPWVRAPPARMPARIRLQCAGGRDARAPGRVGYPRDEQLPLHCAVTPAPLSPAPATRRRRRRCPVARRRWRPSRASE